MTNLTLDDNGFLADFDAWNTSIAEQLAAQNHIELSDAHWEILTLLRRFYQTYNLSPSMRPLSKFIKQELGPDKASSIYLMQLFPQSPAKFAALIAGLPKPDNCL